MKILSLLMAFVVFQFTIAGISYGQNQIGESLGIQPKIMVIPYTKEGEDLRTILEKNEIKRIALSNIKEAFDAKGYTTVDFIAKIKSAQTNKLFTSENLSDIKSQLIEMSGADVYVQAEDIIEKSETGNSVKLILTAFEVSTGNSLANKVGESGKFYTDNFNKLASRAVNDCVDDFLNAMQAKFTAMVNNGKSVIVDISFAVDSKYTMASEVGADGLPLSDQIEMWMEENAFKNNYHIQGTSELKMIFDDVKIPLKTPVGSNYNPNKFALELYKFFKKIGLQTSKTVNGSSIYITIKSGTANNIVAKPIVAITGTSDVDTNIPVSPTKDENAFALIIGNETYTQEIAVPFAVSDASTFRNYVQKTLGVPDDHVHFLSNATYGQMLGEIDWITNVIKAYNGKAKVYFYYAGHGLPDEATKSAYLLPVDGYSGNLHTSVKLGDIYDGLTKNPAQSVNVFLDACFSGSSRTGMLTTGRGVKIKPKKDIIGGNMIILSASSGEETAHPYTEKSHGLFTYFLLKKLQETGGNTTWLELSDYVIQHVGKVSVVKNKSQTPSVIISPELLSNWKARSIK